MKALKKLPLLVSLGICILSSAGCGSGSNPTTKNKPPKIDSAPTDTDPIVPLLPLIELSAPSTPGPVNINRFVDFVVTFSGEEGFIISMDETHVEVHGTETAGCQVEVQSHADQNSKRIRLSQCTGTGEVRISIKGEAALDKENQAFPDSDTSEPFTVLSTESLVVIDSSELGPSPSRVASSRTLHMSGDGIVQYKALRLQAENCSTANFSSAIAQPISTPFQFLPLRNVPNIICAIGLDEFGNWQSIPTASSILMVDTIPPTLTFDGSLTRGPLAAGDSLSVEVNFSDADQINFSETDLIVESLGATCEIQVQGSQPQVRSLLFSSCTGNGSLEIQIRAGVAQDGAGNLSAASALLSVSVENP